MSHDSLRLFDIYVLDSLMLGGTSLDEALGDTQINLDHWACFDNVFETKLKGMVSNETWKRSDDPDFLFLDQEHVQLIIDALESHVDELTITTREDIETLKDWKEKGRYTYKNRVAYMFGSEGCPEARQKSEAIAAETPTNDEISKTQIVVETRNLQLIMLVVLGLIFVPMSIVLGVSAVDRGRILSLLIAAALLIIYSLVMFLFVRAYRISVRSFDPVGLIRNDGKTFPWTDLVRIVEKVRLNRTANSRGLWRVEIEFQNGGSAWLLPTKIRNLQEVLAYVRQLPAPISEKRI